MRDVFERKHFPWCKENGLELLMMDNNCPPEETEFAQAFEAAQEDFERRKKKKNANHKRTMHMWKNALEHVWNTRPIEHTQKLIDFMPKVIEAIIEAEAGNEILN